MGTAFKFPWFLQEIGVKAKGLYRVDGLIGVKRSFFKFDAPGGYVLGCDCFSVCHLGLMLAWV